MRALSLCSGVGILDLAMQWAGMEIVGQVEIDPWCRAVLAKHWPHVKRMADIKEVQGNEFGAINIISGGVPCQPFSRSGNRRGTEDDRHLWPQAFGIIATAHPTWCVIENVNDYLPLVLDIVQTDLESEGYEVWPAILPACAVDAPHIRERAVIVAHSLRQQPKRERGLGAMGNATSCGEGDEEERQRIRNTACHRREKGMADAQSAERQRTGNTWARRDGPANNSADVEHAHSTRRQGLHVAAGGEAARQPHRRFAEERVQRLFESRICRDADGRSCGMDRVTRWPAYQGEAQHDYEPPRVIPQRVKDHARRLKALGNGVVPQMWYPIFAGIMLIEQQGIGNGAGW